MPCVCVRFPLEAPEPGTYCIHCDEPMNLKGYCGACDAESDGLHDGPCELEDGYGEWPYDQVRCVKCLAAIRKSK
jgi:hypothetical protein